MLQKECNGGAERTAWKGLLGMEWILSRPLGDCGRVQEQDLTSGEGVRMRCFSGREATVQVSKIDVWQ